MRRETQGEKHPFSLFGTESFSLAEDIINATDEKVFEIKDTTSEQENYILIITPRDPMPEITR